MPTVDNNTPVERISLKIPVHVHREVKIEAAHSGKDMSDLIAAAWELYKEAVPSPWREPSKKRKAS